MAEFKIGDKVVLVPRQPEWTGQEMAYTWRMVEHCLKRRVFRVMSIEGGLIRTNFWTVRPEWIKHAPAYLDKI